MCIGNVSGRRNYNLYRLHRVRRILQYNQFDQFVWIKALFYVCEDGETLKADFIWFSPHCNEMVSRLYHWRANIILANRRAMFSPPKPKFLLSHSQIQGQCFSTLGSQHVIFEQAFEQDPNQRFCFNKDNLVMLQFSPNWKRK